MCSLFDAKEALKGNFTMPLGKKRKRTGFVGTPAWKKWKDGESSSTSSVPCGQGTPELFNSNASEQTSDSCSASYSSDSGICKNCQIFIIILIYIGKNGTAK